MLFYGAKEFNKLYAVFSGVSHSNCKRATCLIIKKYDRNGEKRRFFYAFFLCNFKMVLDVRTRCARLRSNSADGRVTDFFLFASESNGRK